MRNKILTFSLATLIAGSTATLASEIGQATSPSISASGAHLRLATPTQAAAGPLETSLPVSVEAGSSATPVRAGTGYHFELLSGARSGSTSDAVVVKKGSKVAGYIDNASLVAGNNHLVSAKWKIDSAGLTLDARTVNPKEGSLKSYLAYSAATPVAAGMPTVNYGFVSIPSNYVYNPKLGTLHDYCTKSPDSFGSANFRGPCARHDLCFGSANRLSGWSKVKAKQSCNNTLWSNMLSNCDAAYSWYNPTRTVCHNVAHGYWVAVTAVNP